jgi:hypothetical protein
MLAEVLRVLSKQMHKSDSYLEHEVIGELSFVNQALSQQKIGRKYVGQTQINQCIPSCFV